jgi:hypothetical protein
MGMGVDQSRHHQTPLGADRSTRVRGRQRRRDRDDLAVGDADIHRAAQPAGWIQHITTGKQKVVFHRRSFPSHLVDHSRPLERTWQLRAIGCGVPAPYGSNAARRTSAQTSSIA